VEVAGVLGGGMDLGGVEGEWGVVMNVAEWRSRGCRLVHTYRRLPWEETEVGGDHLGAKHGYKEDMWVDVAQGASRE
jgi:hypothetical protein